MEGDRKRFSKGWFTGLVLGTMAAGGAAVYAVTIPNTFQDGQTASAAQVNQNFEALRDAINGTGPCDAGMTRVGPACVDTDAKVVTSVPAGCQPTGQGCSGIATGAGPGVPYSWGQALAACASAGKRLAHASEIIAGYNAGALSVDNGAYLYVDAAAAREAGAYAGTHLYNNAGTFELAGVNTPYTEQFPNAGAPNIVMTRCAR